LGCCVLDNLQVFFYFKNHSFPTLVQFASLQSRELSSHQFSLNPSVSAHSKTFAFVVQISRKRFQEFCQQFKHCSMLYYCFNGLLGFLYSFFNNIFCKYMVGSFFFMYRLSFQENIMFGAFISATNLVSILVVFEVLNSLMLHSMKHLIILWKEFQKSFDNHNRKIVM